MANALDITFSTAGLDALAATSGAVVALWRPGAEDGPPALSAAAAALDAAGAGQGSRALARAKGELGETTILLAPHGLAADALILLCVGAAPLTRPGARKLGASLAKALTQVKAATALIRFDDLADADPAALAAEALYGLQLRGYRFDLYKSEAPDPVLEQLTAAGVDGLEAAYAPAKALADSVVFTRDLVHEPANMLTPPVFAQRAAALAELGVEVETLDAARLQQIGMRALLAVGQGSVHPASVVAMRWRGVEGGGAPICLVGKGVCFDTGGVSLKPAAGMEEMTMDMAGAGVVTGVMRALAARKSKVDVVGLIGLVENMPDGEAQRPGDVVTSLSGKTIEVINTDAEGRLVLADLLWHAQETYAPRAIVDLATLTGAVIVALGHEKAGLFANDEGLAAELIAAAEAEGEGIWRLPLGDAYDKMIKSRIADMKNSAGRPASSVTAAQFLQRFVKDGQPWAHLDIAGVALTKEEGPTWPRGASGWGVATLTRWVEETYAKL